MSKKIELKTDHQLSSMAAAGVILRQALDVTVAAVRPGVRTQELNDIFAEFITEAGAKPNFLNYYGFPGYICTSVNEEVVHGIPGSRVIEPGDVVKIDGGCIIDGWHSDSARTVLAGEPDSIDPADQRLSDITHAALWAGIAAFARGGKVADIGVAIEDYVTSQPGQPLGILEDYVGHGIGSAMHMSPDVFNFATAGRTPKIQPGMALAIEPMITRGGISTHVLADDWTIVTDDHSRASQWEHSVCRHSQGIWVLTAADGGAADLAQYGITPTPIPEA